VFGLPHIGSATMRTRVVMARLLAESMRAVFAGEAVANRLV
jgi:lactate dehydrogenase-like 2-hydroxyacid dehydrogenase